MCAISFRGPVKNTKLVVRKVTHYLLRVTNVRIIIANINFYQWQWLAHSIFASTALYNFYLLMFCIFFFFFVLCLYMVSGNLVPLH